MSRAAPLAALGAALGATLGAACAEPAHVIDPGPVAARDRTPPTVQYRVARLTDSTIEVDGQATDDRAVASLGWLLVRRAAASPADTLRGAIPITPGRSVAFRTVLPPRATGDYDVVVTARDSANNVGLGLAYPVVFGPPPVALVLTGVQPAGDTLTQRGLDIGIAREDGRRIVRLRMFVDSGTATQQEFRWSHDGWFPLGVDSVRTLVYAPGPGRHTFAIWTADSGVTNVGAHVTRTFAMPDVAYGVTALPDLGAGGGAKGLDERGDVAGWVLAPNGRQRPALWRGGALSVLAAGDTTLNVAAVRVNSAGDALLYYGPTLGYPTAPTAVYARRADGAIVPVTSATTGDARYYCCRIAADLNERREAVGASLEAEFHPRSITVDLATGTVRDDSTRYLLVNDAGQAAGTTPTAPPYPSVRLATRGFTAPALPAGAQYSVCDLPGRFSRTVPVDLDDAANVLVDHCGNPALLGADGQALWLDRLVGRGQIHLSRVGGVVASLDASGALFLWRLGTTTVSRVRLADARWSLDSLAGVTSGGVIAAQGVDASGRRAALLLRPAAP